MKLFVFTLYLWEHSGGCVVVAHDEAEAIEAWRQHYIADALPLMADWHPEPMREKRLKGSTYTALVGDYQVDRVIEAPFAGWVEVIAFFDGTDH